jgi:ribonuclease HIII
MIVKKHGQDRLNAVAKLHFKTTKAVLGGSDSS